MRRQGSSTNDNVPDKDKYLTANWRNMCVTSVNVSFTVSLKLLGACRFHLTVVICTEALEVQKLQMKKYLK